MKGAAILDIAVGRLSILCMFWSLQKFPLSTFIVCNESSHILLYFLCSDSFFEREHLSLGFLLLFADITTVRHARFGSVFLFFSDKILFTPFNFSQLVYGVFEFSLRESVFDRVPVLEFIGDESSIEGAYSFEINCITFNDVL